MFCLEYKQRMDPVLIAFFVVASLGAAAAIVLTLVFTLTGNRPSDNFNGPDDINGDVGAAPPGSFGAPQIVVNPTAGDTRFGEHVFTHQAGYLCVTSLDSSNQTILNMYKTNLQGVLEPLQRINFYEYLPAGYVVVTGAFAPIFNEVNEVYYLFVAVGIETSTPSPGKTRYASNVYVLSLDTNSNNNNSLTWVVRDASAAQSFMVGTLSAAKPTLSLKIPFPNSTFTWDSKTPYIGTFGDRIQVVLNDTSQITNQALYIRGSEYNPSLPDGNIYFFVLEGNGTELSPRVHLSQVIQDAVLLIQRECRDDPACAADMKNQDGTTCSEFTPAIADYANGFGSDFFVTSGNGASNVLVAANCTSWNKCSVPNVPQPGPSPKGYVQGFVWNEALGWQQPPAGNAAQRVFNYRYAAVDSDTTLTDGFATSVAWVDNFVLIGQASPDQAGNAQYFVSKWSPTPNNPSNNKLNVLSVLSPGSELTSDFPQQPLYRATGGTAQRYNTNVAPIGTQNELLVRTWFNETANVISVQNPLVDPADPYSQFKTVQNLGSSVSSQNPSNPPDTKVGFGQNTDTWFSRTGLTLRLVTNDPDYSNNSGRFIIWAQKQT